MSLCRQTKASQVQSITSYPEVQLENSKKVYTRRKDIQKIKAKLEKFVVSNEYWTILARFIHGGCSKQKFDEAMTTFLPNNEARKLHNEFIRAILFNAHFSYIPPPNVDLKTMPIYLEEKQKTNNTFAGKHENKNKDEIINIKTYSAAGMGHLPSLNQLAYRVSSITNVQTDEKALTILFLELKQYILLILQKSVQYKIKDPKDKESFVLSPFQVFHAISSNPDLGKILSPSLLAKFQIC